MARYKFLYCIVLYSSRFSANLDLGFRRCNVRVWGYIVRVKNVKNSLDCHLIPTVNKWFIFTANSTASVILSCQRLTVIVSVILR